MNRRRTAVTYGAIGVACLLVALAIPGPERYVVEGPGPLAFDPVLAVLLAGIVCVLTAAAASLDRVPQWAAPDRAD